MSPHIGIAPEGFWLKTHFYMEGNFLHAVTYSCIAGTPEVFKASLDIRPIAAAVAKKHSELHGAKISGEEILGEIEVGGFFDVIKKVASVAVSPASAMNRAFEAIPGVSSARRSVMSAIHPSMNRAYEGMLGASSLKSSAAKTASKMGKTALTSTISSAVKATVQQKTAGNVRASASIAFPKVSAPSIAAFSQASQTVSAIQRPAQLAALGRQALDKNLSSAARSAANKALTTASSAILNQAKSKGIALPTNVKSNIAKAMQIAKSQAGAASSVVAAINAKAKAGSVEAQKTARLITLAKSAQDKLKAIKSAPSKSPPKLAVRPSVNLNGFPALLVTGKGQIVPGRYVEKSTAPLGVALRGGKVYRGRFAVAGDLSDLTESSDYRAVFGCGSPFNRPAHLR